MGDGREGGGGAEEGGVGVLLTTVDVPMVLQGTVTVFTCRGEGRDPGIARTTTWTAYERGRSGSSEAPCEGISYHHLSEWSGMSADFVPSPMLNWLPPPMLALFVLSHIL